MSTDQPPPGQPPDDDPFLKKPQEPTPPANGSPYGQPPPGSGGGYPPPPPPPPYGGGPGDPYGHGGPGGYGHGMPDPLAGMPPLADTGKRLLARVIDFLVVGIPLWVIYIVFAFAFPRTGTVENGELTDTGTNWINGLALLVWLLSIVAFIGYDWLLTQKGGQTLGKKAMRLRVAVLNDGRVPSSGACAGRAVTLWLPAFLCCGVWWIIVGISILIDKPYQQGLHDKAAGTVVVTVP
ncbi:RDD family protein [Streptomyces sp. NPDC006687]|uniref:RDD family protein n=1 Tax=unclassified Streptomyces TaxID=2593676 RepID=UPI0033E111C2